MQFCKCTHPVSVYICPECKTENSLVPAVSNGHFQFVLRLKHLGHIIDLILEPVAVACPARRHAVISHPLSVQGQFIYALCSCIDSCLCDFLFQRKFFEKDRTCCFFLREIVGNHFRMKIFPGKQSCLKTHLTICTVSVVIFHFYRNNILGFSL